MLGALPARGDADAGTGADGATDTSAPVPDARALVPDARAPAPNAAPAAPIGDGGADVASPVPAAAPAPLPAAAPVPPGETTVRVRRRDSGQTTLSPADVRNMPGAFGDPFRAI